jgi:hypothetical protein
MSLNYPIWVINRLPQYWDRPNEFWPERWLDAPDLGASGLRPVPKNNSLPFIPFNFGPRTCLGMKMVQYLSIHLSIYLFLYFYTNINYYYSCATGLSGGEDDGGAAPAEVRARARSPSGTHAALLCPAFNESAQAPRVCACID